MATFFVSNREIVVRSARAGMSILFEKGVPTQVPRIMHAEVLEKGIMPVEADGTPVALDAVVAPPETNVRIVLPPEDGDERNEMILQAMEAIYRRNDSKAFTAGGIPSRGAVRDALGWGVDQKEIRILLEANRERLIKPQ